MSANIKKYKFKIIIIIMINVLPTCINNIVLMTHATNLFFNSYNIPITLQPYSRIFYK